MYKTLLRGDDLERGKIRCLYKLSSYLFLTLTLVGNVVFYSGIHWEDWYMWVLFAGLIIYMEVVSVDINKKMVYSLSHSIAFPSIFLYGPTVTSLLFGLTGLMDGIVSKKSRSQMFFSILQLILSGLVSSVVFKQLGGATADSWHNRALMMVLTSFVFIVLYLLTQAIVYCSLGYDSWFTCTKKVFLAYLFRNVGSGFIGIIFTLFIDAYGFLGLLGFSLLLIYLSKLFKTAEKVSQERSTRLELEEEVLIDDLTQVYNFRYLNNWLNDSTKENLAILFLDIDNFKRFNDLYGHAEGDHILKLVTDKIKESVRESDSVIRYGGDEFVVLLPNQNKEQAHLIAQRILKNTAKIFEEEKKVIELSIGIASSPYDTIDKRQLLMRADQAMYTAKTGGKNKAHLWVPEDGSA